MIHMSDPIPAQNMIRGGVTVHTLDILHKMTKSVRKTDDLLMWYVSMYFEIDQIWSTASTADTFCK